MKKIIGILIVCFLLTGCNANVSQDKDTDVKKKIRIEVYSIQDDKLLTKINKQATVNKLLATYDWKSVDKLPDNLTPEYKILVYQEKTLLFGQDAKKKRDYELIETLFTFQNSPYVEEVISSNVIKNMVIPEDARTSYYVMPDEVMKEFHDLLS